MKKFQAISKWMISKVSIELAIITFAIFLLFCLTILPAQSAKAASYTGSEGSPDLSLYYPPEDLYKMAEQFGSQGRQAYVKARFTFDLAFPIVYGAFLITSITWLLKKAFLDDTQWRLLIFLPLAAILFDLLENTFASIVIARYPLASPVAACLAPYFTLIKWLFVGGSFSTLFILVITYLLKEIKNRER